MGVVRAGRGLTISRHFTDGSTDPYDAVGWQKFDAELGGLLREGVEFPEGWSQNAANIVSHKYFYGPPGNPGSESSLRRIVDRVTDTIRTWGISQGYFGEDGSGATLFAEELQAIIIDQRASFNTPVWFNIGVPGKKQACSACFILSVDDKLDSILNWYAEEGRIFKQGSGSGVNLSRIRSTLEPIDDSANLASGPVSFMRGADASAGVIKSGATTRRAAKMVLLNVDHPDVEEFIWCKKLEEDKARALSAAGFDMSFESNDMKSIQFQNANNSVRASDNFMEAVEQDATWQMRSVTTGDIVKEIRARDLMHQIAEAAWACGDPGMQFDSTINRWHTTPDAGRINASNPCAEYMHLDNSACNLASINLLKFVDDEGIFDLDSFRHVVDIMIVSQDAMVSQSYYPTQEIAKNAHRYRQLGLGYANLGALIMSQGLAYDSDEARDWAGAITSLMTASAYEASVELAKEIGPFEGYEADNMLRVLRMHAAAALELSMKVPADSEAGRIAQEATQTWDRVVRDAQIYGVRNAQVTVLAPTGTIGLMMDCDTLGMEPDFSLVKDKKLSFGGSMKIVNQSVGRALRRLDYAPEDIEDIELYIRDHGSVVGSKVHPQHLAVFDCAVGEREISPMGHIRMMSAIQPFLSGAMSKTVNCPNEFTVEDIESLYMTSWRLGIKAISIYRDGCKVAQPLETGATKTSVALTATEPAPRRAKLPKKRRSNTQSFRIAGSKAYLTVGEYEDGSPGEVFLKLGKQGSTLSGLMDALAIMISIALQHGTPLEAIIDKLSGMRFEPAGMTDDADIRFVTSVVDYAARRLAIDYLDEATRRELNILTIDERLQAQSGDDQAIATEVEVGVTPESGWEPKGIGSHDAPLCFRCGIEMVRAGSCHLCPSCGESSGCS